MTYEKIYKGFELIRHRKAQKALKLFKQITEEVTDSDILSLSYSGKGYALLCMYKYHAANLAFNTAIELRPNNMLAHAYKYKSLMSSKDKHSADQEMKSIEPYMKDFSESEIFNAWDMFGIAEILFQREEFDQAEEAFKKCTEKDEKLSIIALNGIARCYGARYFKKPVSPDEALEKYFEVLEKDSKFAASHFNMGRLFKKSKQLDKAGEEFDKAIAIDSNYAEAYNGKGAVLAAKADQLKNSKPELARSLLEQAIQMFDESIRSNPEYPNPYMNKGLALYNFEMYDQAIIVYDHALRIDPYYVKTYNAKGNAFCGLQKYDEALKAHSTALRFDPKNYVALNDKAWCLLKLGRYEEALDAADEAIKVHDDVADAHHTRGAALKAMGNLDEALHSYSKSLELLKPQQYCYRPIVFIDMGSTLFEMEEYHEALKYFEMAKAVFYNSKDLDLDSQKILQNVLGQDGKKGEILLKSFEQLIALLDKAEDLNTIEIEALRNPIKEVLEAVDIRYMTPKERMEKLGAKLSFLQEQVFCLRDANSKLEHKLVDIKNDVLILTEDMDALSPILENVEIFAKEVPKLTELQGIDDELYLIMQDPYKKAFYDELRSNLNAVYLAARVVSSGIVDHAKKGDVGKVGAIIKYAGEHVPLVGIGFKIIGSLLKSVDYNLQLSKLESFADIAKSNSEMEVITNTIARRLALDPNFEIVAKEKNILSHIKDWVLGIASKVSEMGSLDFEELSDGKWEGSAKALAVDLSGQQFIADKAISLVRGNKISAGNKAASIVAKVVTKILFDGKLSGVPEDHIVTKIIGLTKIECDAILEIQGDVKYKDFATKSLLAIKVKETKDHKYKWKEKEGLERAFIQEIISWLQKEGIEPDKLDEEHIGNILDKYQSDLVMHINPFLRSPKAYLSNDFLDSADRFTELTGLRTEIFEDSSH